MLNVRELAEEIVRREGGFVNDPSDPGGATNWGVTIGTLKSLGVDVNRDGKINIADVKALPRAQAIDIFLRHYFEAPGIIKLPTPLQASVFDMYVNAGANAVKVLQRLVTKLGFPCGVDGEIGRQTVHQCELAFETNPALADAYAVARREYYYALADSRPASRKYARRKDGGKGGWIIRAEEFMRPELRLTDAQHRARVSAWP